LLLKRERQAKSAERKKLSTSDNQDVLARIKTGTYTTWAYDRGDDGDPILVVAYLWELDGLRGTSIIQQWSPVYAGKMPEDDEHLDADLRSCEPEAVDSLAFAGLVREGRLKLVGEMPRIGEFATDPSHITK
jgi:hypothetical protein